jgi:hypothetical protein
MTGYLIVGFFYNIYISWYNACAGVLSCNGPLTFYSTNNPLFDVLTGNFAAFISTLTAPNLAGFSVLTALFSVLIGAVLLIFSFVRIVSISIVASGATFGVSDQGAKTAQVVGIALLIWGFTSSLEGAWILSLPYGAGAIITGAFLVMFVFATWAETQSQF